MLTQGGGWLIGGWLVLGPVAERARPSRQQGERAGKEGWVRLGEGWARGLGTRRAMLILSSSCAPGSSCRLRMLRREWPLSIRGSSVRLPSVHRRAALGSTPPPPPPPPPLPPLPGVVSRVNATSTQEQFICFRSHRKRSSRTTAPTSLAAASASSAELPASWARVRLPVATSRCKCTAAPPSAPHSAIPRSPSTVSPTASVCPPNTRGQRCAHDISRRTHRKLWWTATNSEFIDRRGELRMLNTEPASPRTSYGAPSAPLKSMSARVVAWSSEPIPPRPEPHSEPHPTPNPNPHQVGEQLQP